MTKAKREKIEEWAVAILLLLLLAWILWHMFGKSQAPTDITQPVEDSNAPSYTSAPATVPTIDLPPLQLPQLPGSGSGCCCNCSGAGSGGCAPNVNTIQSLAQIVAMSNAAAQSIIDAGNNTVETLAQMNNNPLLSINFGSTQG